jgi:phage terminase large subunit
MYDMARADPDWFAEILTVDDTGMIARDIIEKQRKEYYSLFGQDAGDALIEQEYWCSFDVAILGAYYGREIQTLEKANRVAEVPVDPNAPVHTVWDLGVGDSTAIWFFQTIGPEIHIVDFYEASGYAVGHFAKMKKERGYDYGFDYVPHDAKQRSWTDGDEETGIARQRIEVMIDCGLKPKIVPQHTIADGISAVRQTLPRCWFDKTKCRDGLERLRQYRREWDEDKKCFKEKPLHDWASHAADAFRYLALAWRMVTPEPVKPAPKFLQDATLDDLWETQSRQRGRGRL